MKCTSKLVNRPPSCRNFRYANLCKNTFDDVKCRDARSGALQALVNCQISRALGALLVMQYFYKFNPK